MNDTINSLNTNHSANHSKTRAGDVLSSANATSDAKNGADISGSSATEDSFQGSMQKAYEDSLHEQETNETETGGNDLPVSDHINGSEAEDGRPLSLNDFNRQSTAHEHLADQQSVQNQNSSIAPVTVSAQSVSPGIEINIENQLNNLSSQPQRFLKFNPEAGLNPQAGDNNVKPISGRPAAVINMAEKSANLQVDTYQLNMAQNVAQTDLPVQKGQLSTMTIQQQHMLSTSQTSLISHTATAQADSNTDSLPLLFNSSANNFSTINSPSMPQAEIVETFARPQWSQGMGKQILLMVNQNINSAEIRLNPAHLGPIEVLIDMSDDQVNVSLSSRHAVVREAMELALPKLREMLDANGFNLGGTDISQHSFAQQREQNAENSHASKIGSSVDQPETSAIEQQPMKKAATSIAMVDYYI